MENKFQEQILHVFINELEENIEKIEEILFEDNFSKDNINSLFRVFHTIKGSSSFAGFEQIKDFTHSIENLFQEIRNNNIKVDDEIKEFLFTVVDLLKNILKNLSNKSSPFYNLESSKNSIIDKCNTFLNKKEGTLNTFFIKFKPPENIYFQGLDPLIFLNDLKKVGKFDKVSVNYNDLFNIPLKKYKPDRFLISWGFELKTKKNLEEIKSIFEFIDFEDNGNLEINEIDSFNKNTENNKIEKSDKKLEKFEEKIKSKNITGLTSKEKDIEKKSIENTYIKVNSNKIEILLNLIKDISILSSMALYNAENNQNIDLNEIKNLIYKLNKMILKAQQQTLELKMVPVKNYIIPLKRKIETFSKKINKKINFTIEGLEEEMDKQIIDNIIEPIEHILRNALDHGIESPEIRKGKGKSEIGNIDLKIYRQKNNTYIEIKDDGKGLDKDAIIKKAISLNLLNKENSKKLKDEQIYDFIFKPGFSTAKKLTEISGRGVGLDVVKTSLLKLNGQVDIKSEKDLGTTFLLKLPLTLAVIDCMIFKIKDIYFAIPLTNIKHIIYTSIKNILNKKSLVIEFNESFLDVINVFNFLKFNKSENFNYKKNNLFFIIETQNSLKAFYCEEIIGQQNLVVNSLSINNKKIKGIFGTAILGDGEICYILEPDEIHIEENVYEDKIF